MKIYYLENQKKFNIKSVKINNNSDNYKKRNKL